MAPGSWSDNGLNPAKRFEWVVQLREMVLAVHAAKALVVDLNAMNVLVSRTLDGVYLIDVDSFQTAGHPATAQADSIRDRQSPSGQFGEGTDWFAFAVVTFQLMVGVHPYRGLHPSVKTLDDRMKGNLSVFHDTVKVPHVAAPFSVLPEVWRRWYRRVFEEGYRGPPPSDTQYSVMPLVAVGDVRSVALSLHAVLSVNHSIYEAHDWDGTLVVRTEAGVQMNGRQVFEPIQGRVAFGMAGPGVVAMAQVVDGCLQVVELGSGACHRLALPVESVASSDGRMYAKSGGSIMELHWYRSPKGWVCVPKMVGRVMPYASRLFHGVAVQTLLGATYVSLLIDRGKALQLRVPELDGAQVIEAKYQSDVMMVRVRRNATPERWVFRRDGHQLVGWKEADSPLNFAVLNGGVVVDWLDDGAFRLFSNQVGQTNEKRIEDEALLGVGRVFALGGVWDCFAIGPYRVRMSSPSVTSPNLSPRRGRPLLRQERKCSHIVVALYGLIVITEFLSKHLSAFIPSSPVYFCAKSFHFLPQGQIVGGAWKRVGFHEWFYLLVSGSHSGCVRTLR